MVYHQDEVLYRIQAVVVDALRDDIHHASHGDEMPSLRSNQKVWIKKSTSRACRFFGGGKGIRTLVGLLPNGFQDRLVMTTSISLRVVITLLVYHKVTELSRDLHKKEGCRLTGIPNGLFIRL